MKLLKKLQFIFYKTLAIVLYKANVRIISITAIEKGIGHHIIEPLSILKALKKQKLNSNLILFFAIKYTYSKEKQPFYNKFLLDYVKKFLKGIIYEYHPSKWEKLKFKFFAPILYPNYFFQKDLIKKNFFLETRDIMTELKAPALMFKLMPDNSLPTFKVSRKNLKTGSTFFKTLDIPSNAWFVTCHARTPDFYKGISYEGEYLNRCVDIKSYHLALKFITEQGGYVFFIGNNPKLLPPEIKSISSKIINIAETDFCEKELSPFLFGECKFFIGCNSGPALIPGNFNRPTVQVNTSPYWGIPIFSFDTFIFKKLWLEKENRFLSLSEMFQPPLHQTNLDSQFKSLGLKVVDNTPEEILEAVQEMFNRVFHNTLPSKENLLRQKEFKKSFPKDCYAFYFKSNVGDHFLKEMMELENKAYLCSDVIS